MHRGGAGRPKPRVERAGPRTHLPAPRPAPSRTGGRRAGGLAGASLPGRPLPGRVTSRTPREPWRSYAKNVRAEPSGWHPRARAPPPPPRPAQRARGEQATPPPRPHPAERGRRDNGITGAERCLFSTECQEIRRGGCQAHLPGVGDGRGRREGGPARPGLLGEGGGRPSAGVTGPSEGSSSESTDSFPGRSESSFLLPGEPNLPPGW